MSWLAEWDGLVAIAKLFLDVVPQLLLGGL